MTSLDHSTAFAPITTRDGRIRYRLTDTERQWLTRTVALWFPDIDGMTLAQAALAYAQAGWYVLPTHPEDIKNPGSAVGARWPELSSRDPAQIGRWWTENPCYGIALHVGRSGAVAFDLDAETLDVITNADRADIAEALRSCESVTGTRRDGDRGHYLFGLAHGEQLSNSAGAFARFGEVRGRNGVLIAAPTPHPDADTKRGCYRQIRTGAVLPLPDVLRAVLSETAGQADPLTYGELEAFLDAHPGNGCGHTDCRHTPAGPVRKFTAKVAEGASRHETMCHDVLPWAFREAIAGCYSARVAFDRLAEAFAQAKPDAGRGEFYRIAAWAAAQAQAEPGQVQHDNTTAKADDPSAWLDDPDAELGDDEHDVLAGMRNGTWLDAQQFPPLEYVVPGLITEGAGILVGPPKLGKSWMVANIGLACAAGGLALGRIRVKQRPVLYFALEDGERRLQSRFRTIMDGESLPGIDYITDAKPGEAGPMIREYLTRHRDGKPLVIVDTLGKVRPRRPAGVDPYQWDYDVCSALKDEVDQIPGAALLVVHHSRKAESSDFIDAASGTMGITGAFDFVLVLHRKRHCDDAILSVAGRDIAEAEYALTTRAGRWTLDGDDLTDAAAVAVQRRESGELGDRSTDALGFVNARPLGTRPADLASHLGIDSDTAGRYLRRLHDAGRIAKRTRGIYTPLSELSEVSESDEPAGQTDRDSDTSDTVSETGHPSADVRDRQRHGQTDTSDTSDTNGSEPPGAVTEATPGMTERVRLILERNRNGQQS